MERKSAKKYCAVFNCLNADCDPNLTFFKLPKDAQRRQEWLSVIDREDLLSKENLKYSSYYVCSSHFEKSAIKIVQMLNKDAIPSVLLPNHSQEGTSQTEVDKSTDNLTKPLPNINILSNKVIKGAITKSVAIQTESTQLLQKETQTSQSLTAKTPQKRKLKDNLNRVKSKCRRLENELKKIERELKIHQSPQATTPKTKLAKDS